MIFTLYRNNNRNKIKGIKSPFLYMALYAERNERHFTVSA